MDSFKYTYNATTETINQYNNKISNKGKKDQEGISSTFGPSTNGGGPDPDGGSGTRNH